MDRRKIDVVTSAILIVVGIIILTNDNLVEGGAETDLGSLFLPRLVATLMIIVSAFIGVEAFRKLAKGAELTTLEYVDLEGSAGVIIYIAIFVLYWVLVPVLGFLVTTPFVMMSVATLLGGRKWFAMTALSVVTPVLIFYGCSYFLRVFLPTWSLS